jgi:hypothetical protein
VAGRDPGRGAAAGPEARREGRVTHPGDRPTPRRRWQCLAGRARTLGGLVVAAEHRARPVPPDGAVRLLGQGHRDQDHLLLVDPHAVPHRVPVPAGGLRLALDQTANEPFQGQVLSRVAQTAARLQVLGEEP